ncbi:MAG: energy transducer TonB, partial [Muribaculaceae bacterium]|nr:energy transducer TonB [Muribaculaceae bacterium]
AEQGEPVKAPVENTKLGEPGDNPKPTPQIEKKITQKAESPVKATEPPATTEEQSKISSAMANKFSGKNGTPGGKTGSNGSGGTGIGVSGTANGREFKGCPSPDVTLRHKTTVKVSVVIDAEGKVISATASGSADASIRRACEKAARAARWSAKKGAAETRGSITFTITPK